VDDDTAAPEPRQRSQYRPSRPVLTVIVGFLILIVIAGTLGNIFLAPLRRDHPLIVLLLDARNRQLVLVSNRMDTLSFVAAGMLRRMLSDPLYFLLGYWYGDRAVRWMEGKLGPGGGPLVRSFERVFGKAAPVMVFLFPGVPVCVLAGATGMSPITFAVCNVAGTLTAVIGLRVFSNAVSGPIDGLTGWVDGNAKWIALAALGSTLILFLQQRRTGTGELQALTELVDDVDDDDAPGL
jgi:membrane protein DedA with SNARE-associated domain